MASHFFGQVLLELQDGNIVLVRENQSIKLEEIYHAQKNQAQSENTIGLHQKIIKTTLTTGKTPKAVIWVVVVDRMASRPGLPDAISSRSLPPRRRDLVKTERDYTKTSNHRIMIFQVNYLLPMIQQLGCPVLVLDKLVLIFSRIGYHLLHILLQV